MLRLIFFFSPLNSYEALIILANFFINHFPSPSSTRLIGTSKKKRGGSECEILISHVASLTFRSCWVAALFWAQSSEFIPSQQVQGETSSIALMVPMGSAEQGGGSLDWELGSWKGLGRAGGEAPHFFNSCRNHTGLASLLSQPRELVLPRETSGCAGSEQFWCLKGKQSCCLQPAGKTGRVLGCQLGVFRLL